MRADAIEKPAQKTLVVPHVTPGRREVGHMLAAFAQAIMLRDARAVAALWEVPAIVVSDDGTRAVSSYEEVTMYFETTARKYDERGISGARAEIQRVSWLTDRLVTVLVRWPYLAADGLDLGRAESCTYVLRRNESDQLRVVAVIEMGPEPEPV
jgi:hypothetical protein